MHGTAWRCGPVVLKAASCSAAELEVWSGLAEVTTSVRLASPVRAADGRWSVGGWAATTWVDGRSARGGEWAAVLDAGDRLHRDWSIAAVPWPAALDERNDPWAIADREAWADGADATPERFGPRQPVHGDVAGNVVLLDGAVPGVLDVVLYQRPAAWARAAAVCDLVAWWDAPVELLDGVDPDLVRRAIVYRTVVDDLRGVPSTYDRVIDHQRS